MVGEIPGGLALLDAEGAAALRGARRYPRQFGVHHRTDQEAHEELHQHLPDSLGRVGHHHTDIAHVPVLREYQKYTGERRIYQLLGVLEIRHLAGRCCT